MGFKVNRVEPCKDSVGPCLLFEVMVEEHRCPGREIKIPIGGAVYSDDGKFLAPLIIDSVDFSSGSSLSMPAIVVSATSTNTFKERTIQVIRIRGRALLDFKAMEYIETRRRVNKYRAAVLNLSVKFLTLGSDVYHDDHLIKAGEQFVRLPRDAVMLKAGKVFLYVGSSIYEEERASVEIPEAQWVMDFLPTLGLGKYALLEVPIPEPQGLPEELIAKLNGSLRSLEEARELVYKTLDVGPPLTALRNALSRLCEALRDLGYAEPRDGGCSLVEERVAELLGGNRELAKLIVESYTRVKRLSTAGPEPSQPHLDLSKPPLTLDQVEGLIGLTGYVLKLVLDALRRRFQKP